MRTAQHTPEKVLREAGLEGRASVKELVAAAKPHDLKNPGYLSKDELALGAADLAAGLAKRPRGRGNAHTNLIAALSAQQSKGGFGPIADGAVPDFSIEAHVMPKRDADLGYEGFFSMQMPRIPQVWTDRILRGGDVPERIAELTARVKAEGPIALASGAKLSIVETAPKVSGYLPVKPPLLHVEQGGRSVYVETKGLGLQAAEVAGRDVIANLGYMDMPGMDRFADHPMVALGMKYGVGRGASPAVAAQLARIVDEVYAGGAGRTKIDAAERDARAMSDAALGQYFLRTGAAAAFAKAAAHIEAHGEVSLGDHDLTISIGDALRSKNQIVAKDEGRLLVLHSHASGVTSAVRLEGLDEGRLDVLFAENGASLGRLTFEADGTPVDTSGKAGGFTVAFNAGFWVGELLDPDRD